MQKVLIIIILLNTIFIDQVWAKIQNNLANNEAIYNKKHH